MALTELQRPNKIDFYSVLQQIAGEISSYKHRWGLVSAFINKMTTEDLDAMGVATGQVRTDLIDLKNVLNEIIALLNNQPVTPTKDPQTVVDNIRKIQQG